MTLENRLARLERKLRDLPPGADAEQERRRAEWRAVCADPAVGETATAALERFTGANPASAAMGDHRPSLAYAMDDDPAVREAVANAVARYRTGVDSGSATGGS